MGEEFICPRSSEGPSIDGGKATWRDDMTCSYCGCLREEKLFELIGAGEELGPTDKNYKVYIDGPDPKAGQPRVWASANFDQSGEGWVKVTPENLDSLPLDDWQRKSWRDGNHWVQIGPTDAKRRYKFYFQHMSEDGKRKFIDLLNGKKMKIGYPGHFYRLPYFIGR